MPDSVVVVGVSRVTFAAGGNRFWTRTAGESACDFINRHSNLEATLIDDPTPGPPIPPPTNNTPPVVQFVSGGPTVGNTAITNAGSWTGSPTYTRQWTRSGAAIPGAIATSYVLHADDLGSFIACIVTATNQGGSTNATSNAVGPVVES